MTKVTIEHGKDTFDGRVAELARAYGGRTSDGRWVFLWAQLAHELTVAHLVHGVLAATDNDLRAAVRADKLGKRARAARARSVAAHKRMVTRRVPNACEDFVRRLAGEDVYATVLRHSETLMTYVEEAQEIIS